MVCKAAGLSWTTTEAVMSLCGAAGRTLDGAAQRRAFKNYFKLTKSTSEKLLRFWFVRGSNRVDHRNHEAAESYSIEKRRKGNRKQVEMAASILVEGRHLADSTIEDLSMEGAKLRLSAPCKLPDKFVLCLWANKQIYRHCEVRWRTRDHIGVQFL